MLWVITPPGLEDFFQAIGRPREPGGSRARAVRAAGGRDRDRAAHGHERHQVARPAMPHVSIGDAEIYYEEQGQGPPLMLVPGLGGQGAFWAPQVARLRP